MDRVTAPSPAAPRRRGTGARALRWLRWAPLLGCLVAAAACSLSQQGVDPPADTFFYPASAVPDPTSSWLFVTNSNADLRYNDGTLVVVDLAGAAADRARGAGAPAWGLCAQEDFVNPLPRSDPPICCWDRLDANILNCDERLYVQSASTVRIGSFAAGMVWQPYCPNACNGACTPDDTAGRLLIGVRGDTSLTWVDVKNLPGTPTFSCGQTGGSLAECGASNRIVDTTAALITESMDNSAPRVNLPDEPYALALDQDRGLLYVGHLVGSTSIIDSGGVSLFDVSGTSPGPLVPGSQPPGPQDPALISPFSGPFPPNSAGAFGITALTLHPSLGQPLGALNVVFASSRYVPLVSSMVPFGDLTMCPRKASDLVVEGAGDTFNPGLVGSEMRGVAFIDPPAPNATTPPPPAQRAYALERVPPDLVGFSIATNHAGANIATPTDLNETCSSPTFLYQQPRDLGEGPRLFVNCFDTGEIYVFDPNIPTLLTTFQVGRGPAGMVFDSARPIAYVIGFSDNNLSVVDLAPGSPTQFHVIQRLGFPSVTPR